MFCQYLPRNADSVINILSYSRTLIFLCFLWYDEKHMYALLLSLALCVIHPAYLFVCLSVCL